MLPYHLPHFFVLIELRSPTRLPGATGYFRSWLCHLANDGESLWHEKAGHAVCREETTSFAGVPAAGLCHVSQCPFARAQVGVVMYGVWSSSIELCITVKSFTAVFLLLCGCSGGWALSPFSQNADVRLQYSPALWWYPLTPPSSRAHRFGVNGGKPTVS